MPTSFSNPIALDIALINLKKGTKIALTPLQIKELQTATKPESNLSKFLAAALALNVEVSMYNDIGFLCGSAGLVYTNAETSKEIRYTTMRS